MILIIDFGSQFNQLIARRVRELKVYCIIEPFYITLDKVKALNPEGIILSGGPSSVYEIDSQKLDPDILNLGIPILGICYGMQYIIHALGGKINKSLKREYGFAVMILNSKRGLFHGIKSSTNIWMSHNDSVKILPKDFVIDGFTKNTRVAAISNYKKKIYGLQFHPEVNNTAEGKKIIQNFILDICKSKQNWESKLYTTRILEDIKRTVGNKEVILGLSGGVDSSVTALLLEKAIGKQLTCIFVDNGFLRKNEPQQLQDKFSSCLKCKINFIKAEDRFLSAISGVEDPEKKRKIIGKMFIKIFDEAASKIKNARFLAQGTLYPDIIESRSAFGGSTSLIKSHHNVGGLPKNIKLKLIEPLKYLFKDEVRLLGLQLKLDNSMVWRQPFPGPGLAIRIIGKVTRKKLSILKNMDYILQEEIKKSSYYKKLWQSFAVLLPVKSVGIMGDKRTYENIAAIRAVTSLDGMTADWARLPHDLLARISNRIINEVRGVNRVMYDISSKPPSTIELE